jgi:hypothetical protein
MLDRSAATYEEFLRSHDYVDDAPEGESGVLFKAPKMLRIVRENFAKEIRESIGQDWGSLDFSGMGYGSASSSGSTIQGISDEEWQLMQMSSQELGLILQEDPLYADFFYAGQFTAQV